ncbi:MAG TPA: hypothetical protein VFS09_01785 [Candidatus Eisenbacteria bacterium]|nr:hypothetical protein [Candidatus Eisenbacteria bacterium]
MSPPTAGRDPRRGPGAPALWIGAAVAAVVGTLLTLAGVRAFGPHRPEPSVRRFAIPAPQLNAGLDTPVRISPNGRYVLYPSGQHLAVRDLETFTPIDVAGSEGATSAFWSPDSKRIAYLKAGALWTSDLTGAGAITVPTGIADLGIDGGDWGEDGNLVLARRREGLYTVPASGGEARLLLRQDSAEVDFRHPQFLPDGRHIIAVATRKAGRDAVVLVSYPEGVRKNLGEFETLAAARYSPDGFLLLTIEGREAAIVAVPFSKSSWTIGGPPVLVASGGLLPSVSSDGSMVYVRRVADDPMNGILLVQNWAKGLARDAEGK